MEPIDHTHPIAEDVRTDNASRTAAGHPEMAIWIFLQENTNINPFVHEAEIQRAEWAEGFT